MIIWKVIYSKEAIDYLSKLPIKIRKRILDKIKFFRLQENPLKYAKKLTNPQYGSHRFRIGNYRAVFEIDDKGNIKILLILTINHRKDIYRK
jgi:mRNA-degrading endonuclease RelE of RelBE toxin-antitoxin system